MQTDNFRIARYSDTIETSMIGANKGHFPHSQIETKGPLALVQPDGITTTDHATLQHRGVDTHVSPVVLSG